MRFVSCYIAFVFATEAYFQVIFFCLLVELFIILITFSLFLKSLQQNNMIKSNLCDVAKELLPFHHKFLLSFCRNCSGLQLHKCDIQVNTIPFHQLDIKLAVCQRVSPALSSHYCLPVGPYSAGTGRWCSHWLQNHHRAGPVC